MKESTEVRLENLERELAQTKSELGRVRRRNLWLLRGGVLAVLLVITWIWILTDAARFANAQGSATVQQESWAKRFVLEDGEGKPRAYLAMVGGAPTLCLSDEEGNLRAILNATKNGSVLSLSDEKNSRASLNVAKAGSMLSIDDEKGTTRASLGMTKSVSMLILYDEKVKDRASLGVHKAGPELGLTDEKGKVKLLTSSNIPD